MLTLYLTKTIPLQPSTYKKYPRSPDYSHLVIGNPLPPEGLDLLSRFLQYDPAKRITAKDAMDVSIYCDRNQFSTF